MEIIISFHRFNRQVVTFMDYHIFTIINSPALLWMYGSKMPSTNYLCEHCSYATSAIHRNVIHVIFNLPLSLHLLVFFSWSISLPWRIKEWKIMWALCSELFHMHVRNLDGCWRIWNLDNLTLFFCTLLLLMLSFFPSLLKTRPWQLNR